MMEVIAGILLENSIAGVRLPDGDPLQATADTVGAVGRGIGIGIGTA
jgi:hypothetical protein